MAHLRPPPLLLTKRLTSFLQLNLSPQITTLLLLSPDGKLLAYASQPPIPVATLRTHGTVAASLYTIHSNGADQDTIDAALPPGSRARRTSRGSSSSSSKGEGPLAVTIQLESRTVLVIRRLRCGMLFVCMGPPAGHDAQGSRPGTQHRQQQQQQQGNFLAQAQGGQASQQQQQPPQASQQNLQTPQAADDTAAGGTNGHTPTSSPPPPPQTTTSATTAQPPSAQHPLGSPRETASIRSAGTGASATSSSSAVFGAGTAGVVATRRHAEELARWLDDKLGALDVPDDGLTGVVG